MTEAEIRDELDRLYGVHEVLRRRLDAGVEVARCALRVVDGLIVQRERALADDDAPDETSPTLAARRRADR